MTCMGLFDRIKNVFTGKSNDTAEVEEVKEETTKAPETPEVSETTEAFEPEVPESPEETETLQKTEETERYDKGLQKSSISLKRRFNELMANFRYIDEDFYDDLEDMLIESDVGYEATLEISDKLRYEAKVQNATTVDETERLIVEILVDMYESYIPNETEINLQEDGLTVILFVGVNGVGKTTTIAKLAHEYIENGKRVMLAAGDTFRAGAIEQLKIWGGRVGAPVVASKQGGDPSAVIYDAIEQAKGNGTDILMVDTAGRLQNKKNLMNELDKMKRVISREIPEAPHEVLLVLDATTGQNALSQAKTFKETTEVTGIALTKMDGTAKGGIVLGIGKELGIPVKFVGLGESMDDLRPFNSSDFAYGLFGDLIEETV